MMVGASKSVICLFFCHLTDTLAHLLSIIGAFIDIKCLDICLKFEQDTYFS